MTLLNRRPRPTPFLLALSLVLFVCCADLSLGQGFCAAPPANDAPSGPHPHQHSHHCGHHHHHNHDHDHSHQVTRAKIPEELAEDEDEDMELSGFGDHYHHDHDHDGKLSGLGLWLNALGCSLLVSLASLICLLILPIIFIQGKPSKGIVDSLALFGAGAMLGDAFLHQLPHAFGGEHSHSRDHHPELSHFHDHHHEHSHSNASSHSHSLKDLSTGLSILAGIVLFLLVEKVVRYVEDNSSGGAIRSHGHHHHHHKSSKKLKDDVDIHHKKKVEPSKGSEGDEPNEVLDNSLNGENSTQHGSALGKQNTIVDGKTVAEIDAADSSSTSIEPLDKKEPDLPSSSLVFGYLNLFSDGVHNFTDGMALGSAFLLYGSVGGWSRTLFLLAHELPQEIGDFGILVRSGFSVVEALFFNFLSALMALAGTAMALLWGQDPGQSSLIEGFTAGGFIYIAVAGVLAEMNNGSSSLRSTAVHVTSLVMGMAVALCISLVE